MSEKKNKKCKYISINLKNCSKRVAISLNNLFTQKMSTAESDVPGLLSMGATAGYDDGRPGKAAGNEGAPKLKSIDVSFFFFGEFRIYDHEMF